MIIILAEPVKYKRFAFSRWLPQNRFKNIQRIAVPSFQQTKLWIVMVLQFQFQPAALRNMISLDSKTCTWKEK